VRRALHRIRGASRAGLAVRSLGAVGAVIPLLALVFVLTTLLLEALPAIRVNGLHFFTATDWNPGNTYGDAVDTHGVQHPVGANYGALPLIVGTVASSAIALIIAVPVSIGAALMIVERLPRHLASAIGMVLELLAGIPSVIVGLWGAMTFGPFIAHHVAPVIARNAPDVPVLDYFRGNTGNGEGLLVSGLVLAVMVIPIIASTTRDLIRQVPVLPREGAVALGLTDWECARRVTLPWVSSGIVGAVVLGLGRALGETMAVAMVSGAVLGAMPTNIYSTMTTIAATVVSELDSAMTDFTDFAVKTLAEVSLVLMVITLLTNMAARALVRRVSGTALPVGRGV
jgi:phosphate transport system permease protein